jgi:hypothetical protein
MPGPTLNVAEMAELYGRDQAWVRRHWRSLVERGAIPTPLLEGSGGLVWSRAQVYAVQDRHLPDELRAAAAAYRAAMAAAARVSLAGADEDLSIDADRIALERRFGKVA